MVDRTIVEDLRLLAEAGLSRGMDVVDFGCGTGFFTRQVARAVGPAGRVVGLSASAFNVARARELAAQEGLENLTFSVLDEKATGLAADFADVALTRYFLGQVPAPAGVVKEMVRVTRPGGLVAAFEDDEGLVVYEPEPPAVTELRALLSRNRVTAGGNWMMGRSLYRLLREAGLERIRVSASTSNSTDLELASGPERLTHTADLARAVDTLLEKGEIDREDAARYQRALEEVSRDPLAFVFVCRFFAVGRKPLRCA
ncbi:MAG: methyltransferase domain-containing protein [Bacillota bacterium]